MALSEDQHPCQGLGEHEPQGFELTNGYADDINNYLAKSPHKIFNNYVSFPQSPSNEDISLLSFGSAQEKSDLEVHNDDDNGIMTTLIIQTHGGATEHVAVPRTAADVISALREEVNTLRHELDSLKSSRQSIQLTKDALKAANGARRAKPTRKISTNKKKKADKVGRWSWEEHRLFLQGVRLHGKRWTKVATVVKTRTDLQIRTHAQKYFQKLAKANGKNGEELEDEVIKRLVEADLKSPPPKSKTKKERNGGKRKMPTAFAGSASSICRGKIDTSCVSVRVEKRHRSEPKKESVSLSPLPTPSCPVEHSTPTLDDHHLISDASDIDVSNSPNSSVSSVFPLAHPNEHSCGLSLWDVQNPQLGTTCDDVDIEAINWLLSDE